MTETSTPNTTGTAQATPAKPQKRSQNARTARPRVLSAMQDLSVSRENIEKELQKRQTRRNNPRGSGLYFGKKALLERLEELDKQRKRLYANTDAAVSVAEALKKERSLSTPRVATVTLRFDDQAIEARVVRYITTLNEAAQQLEDLIPRLISADFGNSCDKMMDRGIKDITVKIDDCLDKAKRFYEQYAIALPRMADKEKVVIDCTTYEYAALRRPVDFTVYSPYVKKWLQQSKRLDFISFLLSVLSYEGILEQSAVRQTIYNLVNILKDYVRIITQQQRLALAELRSHNHNAGTPTAQVFTSKNDSDERPA